MASVSMPSLAKGKSLEHIEMGIIAFVTATSQAVSGKGAGANLNNPYATGIGMFPAGVPANTIFLLSRIVGPQIVAPLIPASQQQFLPPQGVTNNFATIFNGATIGGITLLIVDWGLKMVGVHSPFVSKYVLQAPGKGLLIGGIIGGLFDPTPTNPAAIGNPAGRLAFPGARTPFLGAAGAAMPGTMGGLAGFNMGRGGY